MAKRHFTAEEVEEAVHEFDIHTDYDEPRRWTKSVTTIVKMEDDKCYSLHWEKGLTENIENEYFDQDADEVKEITETRTIKVTSWEIVY